MSKKKDISKKEIKKRIKLEDKIFKLILKSRSKKHPLDEQVYAVIDFLEQLQYSLKELVKEDEQKEQAETEKLIQEELPEPEVREEIIEAVFTCCYKSFSPIFGIKCSVNSRDMSLNGSLREFHFFADSLN